MKLRTLLFAAAASAPALMLAAPAHAQADIYMGEMPLTGANYCWKTTVDANGQILSIAQNQALFSLLGTTYGGNGVTTFALPDLRSRKPISVGQGPGLSNYTLGQVGGQETVTMTIEQMPAHMHMGFLVGVNTAGTNNTVVNGALADFPDAQKVYNKGNAPDTNMATGTVAVAPAGSSQPHPTISPYETLRYCIALQGIYPSKN